MNKLSHLWGYMLLVLMTIVIVPVEYVHALYNHNDTHDATEFCETPSYGEAHIHCIILKTEFREFSSPDDQHSNFEEFYLGSFTHIYQSPLIVFVSSPKEQRGPPTSHC